MESNIYSFTTSDLGELDLNLINVLLTQRKYDEKAVERACKFVLERIKDDNQET